jgi:hypothetical protein
MGPTGHSETKAHIEAPGGCIHRKYAQPDRRLLNCGVLCEVAKEAHAKPLPLKRRQDKKPFELHVRVM